MSDLQAPLRPKRKKIWVDYFVHFRWIIVIFVVLPISFTLYFLTYLGDVRSESKSFKQRQEEHNENVKKVIKRLKERNPSKDGLVCTARKPWIAVGMRNVDYKRARHFEVDLSAFRNILDIDKERMIARCEPLVNMGQISRVSVPMNLALAVVAELDDLTVGGLINGYGIEGSSHIYGLFSDTVVAYEIILADGRLVRATKDNEYSDLFRFYCAADDAFLCQACDMSVHSANPLARRHERVRLKTASLKLPGADSLENSMPSWHQGFTRKARTPRHGKPAAHPAFKSDELTRNPLPFVPEIGADETSYDDNEEQLLYRVPIFDPFVAELCASTNSNEAVTTVANDTETADVTGSETKALVAGRGHDVDSLHGFLPSDMDLAEFAADVESLLGKGLDNESFGMEGLGLIDCKEKESVEYSLHSGRVKLEEEEDIGGVMACQADAEIDMTREPFELNFDYGSPATCEEEEEKVAVGAMDMNNKVDDPKKKNKILLRLDYEAIITAWASQGSPWTNGHRPELDPDDCWPDCLGTCGIQVHHPYGEFGGMGEQQAAMGDGGREARVSRYREKRRTRLFSKKIRYEVRKLNAEKRPRMKGRFVKRASFGGPAAFPLLNK